MSQDRRCAPPDPAASLPFALGGRQAHLELGALRLERPLRWPRSCGKVDSGHSGPTKERYSLARFLDERTVLGDQGITPAASPDRERIDRDHTPCELDVHFSSLCPFDQRIISRWHPIDARDEAASDSASRTGWTRKCEQLFIAQLKSIVVVVHA